MTKLEHFQEDKTVSDEEKMLADDLTYYIKEKHTQQECIGFIDGYKSALNKLKKKQL